MAYEITAPRAKVIFMEALANRTRIYDKFCQRVQSDGSSEALDWLASTGDFEPYIGAHNIVADAGEHQILAYNKRWSLGLDLKDTVGRTRRNGALEAKIRDLPRQAIDFLNRKWFEWLVNGTGTTSGTDYEAGAFFRTDHTIGGDGTTDFSNLLTGTGYADVDDILTDFYAAITALANAYHDNEKTKLFAEPTMGLTLVYPIELLEIFDNTFTADVFSATSNFTKNYSIELMPTPLLSDTKDWYILKTDIEVHKPFIHTVVQDVMLDTLPPVEGGRVHSNRVAAYFDLGFAYGDFRSAIKINNT